MDLHFTNPFTSAILYTSTPKGGISVSNYDRIIIELMNRVSKLEEEVAVLKAAQTAAPGAVATTRGTVRDTTKYLLDNEKYGKSRLVLALVTKYFRAHPHISAKELMTVFPRSLQGSMGVIRPLSEVTDYNLYTRRFFCEDRDILGIDGIPYVVCSQWSSSNIKNILARAGELGIHITVV